LREKASHSIFKIKDGGGYGLNSRLKYLTAIRSNFLLCVKVTASASLLVKAVESPSPAFSRTRENLKGHRAEFAAYIGIVERHKCGCKAYAAASKLRIMLNDAF